MPFKSEKQRRYMWANEPEIARRWADEKKTAGSMQRTGGRSKKKKGETKSTLLRTWKSR